MTNGECEDRAIGHSSFRHSSFPAGLFYRVKPLRTCKFRKSFAAGGLVLLGALWFSGCARPADEGPVPNMEKAAEIRAQLQGEDKSAGDGQAAREAFPSAEPLRPERKTTLIG
jgi:hypothetical protein